MRIWQLEGQDSDLALFFVPEGNKNIQGCFDEAFEACKDSEDLLNDVAEYLDHDYGITRIYIQDYAFTDKL